jgi:hypothetical protein
MIAEKEVVLTFLLQLLSDRGLLHRLAFKGGTCLRKMFIGSQGRFSTDPRFTGLEQHDHEDVILDMMTAFEPPFHGIQFSIPDEGYYETMDGLAGASTPPTFTTGTPAAARSGSKSVDAKRRRCQPSSVSRWSRVTFSTCRSLPPPSTVSPCPKSLPRRLLPAKQGARYL